MLDQAQKDYLTGLYLRGALNTLLGKLISDAKLNKKDFSIALIDLDRFKKFNDKYGHPFGDEILKYASSILRLTFYTGTHHLFRYGGDEFIVVFPESGPKEAFHLLRQCVHNIIHRPFLFKNRFYKITISCGIAGFPHDGGRPEELIHNADKAMYFSKRHGHNLATLADKIRYLRLRNFFVIVGSFCILFWFFFVMYKVFLKNIIDPKIRQIRSIKIVTEPKDLDSIILKTGIIFKGHIVEETEDKVILKLYLEKGEGLSAFDKSDIAKIKYGSKKP